MIIPNNSNRSVLKILNIEYILRSSSSRAGAQEVCMHMSLCYQSWPKYKLLSYISYSPVHQ